MTLIVAATSFPVVLAKLPADALSVFMVSMDEVDDSAHMTP